MDKEIVRKVMLEACFEVSSVYGIWDLGFNVPGGLRKMPAHIFNLGKRIPETEQSLKAMQKKVKRRKGTLKEGEVMVCMLAPRFLETFPLIKEQKVRLKTLIKMKEGTPESRELVTETLKGFKTIHAIMPKKDLKRIYEKVKT